MTTRTKANSNSATKRRILATVLALASEAGHGDGATYADCVACGRKALVGIGAREGNRFELGHVVSDSNGGEYWPTNLVPLCRDCNSAIGSDDMTDVLVMRYDTRPMFSELVRDPGPSQTVAVDVRGMWIRP